MVGAIVMFYNLIKTENPEIKQLLKEQGAANTTLEQIIEQLEITFSLKQYI